jgi:hypothetical protein
MEKIPIFFILSKEDTLVLPGHVEALYNLHKGYKRILYLKGSHNKPRPAEVRDQCAEFLCSKISNVGSQKNFEGSKKIHVTSLSRKYSEDTAVLEMKPKPSNSSFMLNSPQSTPPNE